MSYFKALFWCVVNVLLHRRYSCPAEARVAADEFNGCCLEHTNQMLGVIRLSGSSGRKYRDMLQDLGDSGGISGGNILDKLRYAVNASDGGANLSGASSALRQRGANERLSRDDQISQKQHATSR